MAASAAVAAPAHAQAPTPCTGFVKEDPAGLATSRPVKKASRLALRMETKEQLKNVVVTLKKGSKTLGGGKLATLANISKLSLKLKKKGLKKGRYSLLVTATRADGTTGKARLKLAVK